MKSKRGFHDEDVHRLVLGIGMSATEAEQQRERLRHDRYFIAIVAARYGGYALQVTEGGAASVYHTLFSPGDVDAFLLQQDQSERRP